MSIQSVCWLVCLLVTLVTHSHGFQFSMTRTPNNLYCGYLQCSANISQTDTQIHTLIGLTISDIVQTNTHIRLASVSVFDPEPHVELTRVLALNATGSVSRYHGNLTVALRDETDCQFGSFLCELTFVNVNGQSDRVSEIVASDSTDTCETSSDPVTTLTVQMKTHSLNIERKFTDIDDKLSKIGTFNIDVDGKLTDMDGKLTDMDGKLTDVDGKLTNMDGKLTDMDGKLTDMDGKLTDVDRKLTDMDGKLTDMDGKLTDMDGKLTDVDGKLTDMDGKLTELISNNITVEQELVTLRIQNVAMETKLDKILEELSKLRGEDNTSQILCAKGEPHTSRREKIKLWGRVPALCDTETDGGGWVIIQRRTQDDVDFYKGWYDYKRGFGTPDTDFWLGNDNIHNLTSQGYSNLRVDMEYLGVKYFAEYSTFSVSDVSSKYKLTIDGYHGNAGDALTYHSGMFFSTFDRDYDKDTGNCAAYYHGAWWYNNCHHSHLNGNWGSQNHSGITWNGVVHPGSVTWSEMKIRQV